VTETFAGGATAVWLGILTAISPCPLATNIAAVSYIGRDVGSSGRVVVSGVAYTLGRSLAYVGIAMLVVASVLTIPGVSWFLQEQANRILGPLLIVIGVLVLGWIRVPMPSPGIGEAWKKRAASGGVVGAGFLGMLFALSFCPVSAGLFFGSLIPLSVSARSPVALPALFGVGTGLPVLAVAIAIALGLNFVGRAFDLLTRIERWAKPVTGAIFILAGVFLVIGRFFGYGG
jgi:cytochrome c-type biogenesis protein